MFSACACTHVLPGRCSCWVSRRHIQNETALLWGTKGICEMQKKKKHLKRIKERLQAGHYIHITHQNILHVHLREKSTKPSFSGFATGTICLALLKVSDNVAGSVYIGRYLQIAQETKSEAMIPSHRCHLRTALNWNIKQQRRPNNVFIRPRTGTNFLFSMVGKSHRRQSHVLGRTCREMPLGAGVG